MNARGLRWLALLAITACSASPEIRYYTLTAEPAAAGAVIATRRAAYAVDAVAIPEVLDRPQIVLRSGPNGLDILDNDRWAAPLPDLLRRTLAADLSQRLGASAIIDPGLPAGRSARRIAVSIVELGAARDGQCVLVASWTISGPDAASHRSRHVEATNGGDVAAVVAAMSRLLAALADDIGATVANAP